jgi:tripartite-type tricarboxylate transporter receptor subunit TctC
MYLGNWIMVQTKPGTGGMKAWGRKDDSRSGCQQA